MPVVNSLLQKVTRGKGCQPMKKKVTTDIGKRSGNQGGLFLGPVEITYSVSSDDIRPEDMKVGAWGMIGVEDLVPELGELRWLIGHAETSREKKIVNHMRREMLPYSIMAAQTSLLRCFDNQERVFARVADESLQVGTTVQLSPGDWEALAFPVDTFLESARRCQNALVPYLASIMRCGVDESLASVVEKIQKQVLSGGTIVDGLVVAHWVTAGEKLRAYRVLSQHHAIVSSEARVFRGDDGTPLLSLLLPTNPENKSAKHLKYGNPEVHAYLYALEYFQKFSALVYDLTRVLIDLLSNGASRGEMRRATLRGSVSRTPSFVGRQGQRLLTRERLRAEIALGPKKHAKFYGVRNASKAATGAEAKDKDLSLGEKGDSGK